MKSLIDQRFWSKGSPWSKLLRLKSGIYWYRFRKVMIRTSMTIQLKGRWMIKKPKRIDCSLYIEVDFWWRRCQWVKAWILERISFWRMVWKSFRIIFSNFQMRRQEKSQKMKIKILLTMRKMRRRVVSLRSKIQKRVAKLLKRLRSLKRRNSSLI